MHHSGAPPELSDALDFSEFSLKQLVYVVGLYILALLVMGINWGALLGYLESLIYIIEHKLRIHSRRVAWDCIFGE